MQRKGAAAPAIQSAARVPITTQSPPGAGIAVTGAAGSRTIHPAISLCVRPVCTSPVGWAILPPSADDCMDSSIRSEVDPTAQVILAALYRNHDPCSKVQTMPAHMQ